MRTARNHEQTNPNSSGDATGVYLKGGACKRHTRTHTHTQATDSSRPIRSFALIPEDPEELIDFRIPVEERLLGGHFCKDGPDAPYIYRGRVAGGAKQDLWGSVPQGDNLERKPAMRRFLPAI